MLRCLHNICQAFDAAGKPISICGELAGERDAVELLVGMGYRKLSMTAQRHAAVKSDICSFSVQQAQALLARTAMRHAAGDPRSYSYPAKHLPF